MAFPFYLQHDEMACGPTCLRMITKYYGKDYSLDYIRSLSHTNRQGSSMLGLSEAAEKIGFRTLGVKIDFNKLISDAPLPCIAHWNQNHFVVVYKVQNKSGKEIIYVADPGHGLLKFKKEEFLKSWIGINNERVEEGILLLLESTPEFFEHKDEYEPKNDIQNKISGLSFLFKYFSRYKKFIYQLFLGLAVASLLQLVFPFLTQSIVDFGIQNHDLNFIYLILFAQLMLFLGRTTIEIIRSWILMHVSSRINIALVSDFFIKLMKLPISFFDVKMTGDIMQRISDHHRIEQFMTGASLNVLFSLVNLLIFGVVLAIYNVKIFAVFFIGSVFYFLWVSFFLKKRADLDYKRFSQMSRNQSKIMELILGMQEIKMNNAEKQKRWGWENIQAQLFKINLKSLRLEQAQTGGSSLINELKNILITVLSAKLVIEGQLTLGMMLSVSYIIGQLNSPILQLVTFMQSLQDARLSLNRLQEIHNKADEENPNIEKITDIPLCTDFTFEDVYFKYDGTSEDFVLKNLNLSIPANKVTAIVGASGSGKTTLMKLLLKFYESSKGDIKLGNYNLKNISPSAWREKCGVVMQEGYIFSDTIANNIAVGAERIDKQRMLHAVTVANIREFIEKLPLAYNTKIGQEGIGISTGQKQRILIARAVYKNPDYLFFDEATSALDANNERVIIENLNQFFKGKTVIIVAHRLSTVKNADQIVVLDQGKIVEFGDHIGLTTIKGVYYNLVKNQLELGN